MTTYKFSKKNKLTTGSYNYRKELFKVCDLCTKNDVHLFDTTDAPLFCPFDRSAVIPTNINERYVLKMNRC